MMNKIGKGLVLIHAAISFVALAWAAGLFLQFTDWGWKEPRSDLGLRVPSEYDKRVAAFKEAVKARDVTLPPLKPARLALRQAEERFPVNHLYYIQELDRLRNSPDPIEVKSVERSGPIVLEVPVIGKPVQKEKVDLIAKSYNAYLADLKKTNADTALVHKEIAEWTEKEQTITFLLNGKDAAGKAVKNTVGVYGLLDVEKKAQDEALLEREYLQPIWAAALEQAELYGDRKVELEKTLARFNKPKKK